MSATPVSLSSSAAATSHWGSLKLRLALIGALLIAASVALTLPLAVGLMAWLALIGTLAVDSALKPAANDNDTGIEMELI